MRLDARTRRPHLEGRRVPQVLALLLEDRVVDDLTRLIADVAIPDVADDPHDLGAAEALAERRSGEVAGHALADDHDSRRTWAIPVVEVPPGDQRNAERGESSRVRRC